MEAVFQACVAEVKAEGRTVLLSSHILAEVEALCERVSIIREGRTVQTGSLHELRELTRTAITAETERPVDLAGIDGVHGLDVDGARLSLDVDGPHLDAVVRAVSAAGIRSLTSSPPTLEELFLRHYGDELAADLGEEEADVANGRRRSHA
jgi:ABC-2 type transport system ATP-binding protein